MGWLLAGFVIAAIGAGVSIAQSEKSLSLQEESNRIESYNASTTQLNASIKEIEDALTNIKSTERQNEVYQSEIDVSNEWIENYRKMLSGDRSETTIGIEMRELEGNKKSAENAKSAYLISSIEEKQSAYTQAYDSYTEMLRQKSLLNVAASGTGQLEGAYSAAQLIQNEKIKTFIGNDMVFNSDGEGTSLSDGSFLLEYTSLKKTIALNLEEYSNAIEVAEGNIVKQLDAYETLSKQHEATIADRTEAIEINKDTIETYKETVKNQQVNALTALKTAMENRKGDIEKAQLESAAERLDAVNKSVETHTGNSADYNASETISQMVAEEEAARLAEEEAAKARAYEDDDNDEPVKAEKTQAQKTAERDNERGKAQTEYYKKQLEAQKKAEEEKKKKETGSNKRVVK